VIISRPLTFLRIIQLKLFSGPYVARLYTVEKTYIYYITGSEERTKALFLTRVLQYNTAFRFVCFQAQFCALYCQKCVPFAFCMQAVERRLTSDYRTISCRTMAGGFALQIAEWSIMWEIRSDVVTPFGRFDRTICLNGVMNRTESGACNRISFVNPHQPLYVFELNFDW